MGDYGRTAAWDLATLRAACPDLRVEWRDEVDSTNTRLIEQARGGDTAPALLVALTQTAGRGRQGRPWISRPEASVTFSLALPLAPADWSGLSLAVGVSLADALETPDGRPRLMLKWPNDLVLRDADGSLRKLGGILIETVTAGDRRMAVIGIGLNLHAPQLPAGALAGAGLHELEPDLPAPALLARLAPPLLVALRQFESEGFGAFRERFERRDALAGRIVRTTLASAPEGRADGVDRRGALRLHVAAPEGDDLRLVDAGEVSVRPAVAGQGA